MQFIPAKYHYQGGNTPSLVVIHDMEYPKQEGAAVWCARYFQNPEAGRKPSAHYAIDNREVVQMVNEWDGAWHTPGMLAGREINRMSIGIEHAGYAKQSREEWLDAYSQPMLELSASLVAGICTRYGIPVHFLDDTTLRSGNVQGITGHWQCTKASGVGDHWDPGSGFPWDWYLDRVRAYQGGSLGFATGRTTAKTLATLLALGMMGYAGWSLYKGKPIRLPAFMG